MAHNVRKINLPSSSLLHRYKSGDDFLDCFAVNADIPPRQAAELITTFPFWVKALLRLRSMIVAPFGLSAAGPDHIDKIGPFPVDQETQHEIIAGFNDKHLNFRISVLSHDGQVSLATWVKRHNFGGRLYLAAIMPFHIAVARNALRRLAHASR